MKIYKLTDEDHKALEIICDSKLEDWKKLVDGGFKDKYELDTGISSLGDKVFRPNFAYVYGGALLNSLTSSEKNNFSMIVNENCFQNLIKPLITEGKVYVVSSLDKHMLIDFVNPKFNEKQREKATSSSVKGFNRLFGKKNTNFTEEVEVHNPDIDIFTYKPK